MSTITHNIPAINAQRMYGLNAGAKNKSTEKLSSGYRINRAADDAAGLSISEKMRKQIRGLTQASENAKDGISMVQIADGALEEVHAMLQRGNELAVKAANGTLSESDRSDINQEIQQIKEAIDQVASNTKFNETRLFPSSGLHPALAHTITSNSYTLEFGSDGIEKITHTASGQGAGDASAVNTGNALADKIANEYVPNAVNQILTSFPSLADVINSQYTGDQADKLKMALNIEYVDGPSNTLAYVSGSFYTGSQTLASISMTVDSADFSENDVKNNSSRLGVLESTIAHEMMHAVMDAATPERMYRQGGAEDYPDWFVEGTAQLTGGGYTTGWNDTLKDIIQKGGSDSEISDYLKKYTVQDRVYGHGYLAAAYMAYLAAGEPSNFTAGDLAGGMNKVFKELIDNPGQSLEAVVNGILSGGSSGKTYQDIINDINSGNSDGVSFVRALTTASMDGAGSVIAAGLGAPAMSILGEQYSKEKIYIDIENISTEETNEFGSGANAISIQAGADNLASNRITMNLFRMSSKDLGLSDVGASSREATLSVDALSMEGARSAIDSFSDAISIVSGVRSYYGAMQNRMEHTIKNLDNVVENTTDSESKIRDTDMSVEIVRFSMLNILQQAGESILAQSNQINEGMLSLLQ